MTRAVWTCILLVLLGGLAFGATDARACSCLPVGPETQQERQRRQADAIFAGRVTQVTDPRAGSALRGSGDPVVATSPSPTCARATSAAPSTPTCAEEASSSRDELVQNRTQDESPQAQVVTPRFSASCGIEFREGQAWTVYAVRRKEPLPATQPGTVEGPSGGEGAGWVLWTGLAAALALGLALAAALAVRGRRSGA